ncbi:MAG: phosphoglucosamine mutase [Candidatus Thorarchaeota archaeon]|nr:phosphoglucosamine mutase [Candidatus Thorarchaeota archaeon]
MNRDIRSQLSTMSNRLFGTTGVRKIYGREFDLEMAVRLGKALGTILEEGTVVIGTDVRTTGKLVADALTAGVLSTGVNVVRVGLVPTPTLAFITRQNKYDAGLMVTASHNPPEYTGIKFWRPDGMGYTPEQESQIEAVYDSGVFKAAEWDKLGMLHSLDAIVEDHIAALLQHCDVHLIRTKNYTVVVDPGNGSASVLTPYLTRELGCKVLSINSQADGHFPGRRSEPDETSLGDLIKVVTDIDADLGIAHDGDADRVVFVSERGEVVRGDRTIALLAKEILAKNGKERIVTTVDSSSVLDESVARAGGATIRTPVGDVQVAIKMKESKSSFGGEACGVFIFSEFHLAPEPFLAVCKLLELMARTGRSFGDLISEIPVYPLLKDKIRCSNAKKMEVMETLSERLPEAFDNTKEVLTVDGLGIYLQNGWVLVRPSGTEPVIRITCEAHSKEAAASILKTAKEVVEKVLSS